MTTINSVEIRYNVPAQTTNDSVEQIRKSTALAPNEERSPDPDVAPSVKVEISTEGLKALAAGGSSGPSAQSQAKEIEKIRERMKELQQQIQEQQAQLQAVQANKQLTPEEKAQQSSAISQQIAGLNSALASAMAQLMEAIKGHPDNPGADGVQPLPFVQHTPPRS